MLTPLVDPQISELLPPQRSARKHALHGLFDDTLRKAALEDELRAALLDAADEVGVVVVHLLLALAAGEHHLLGIDDDDVVAVIDMRSVARLLLAAQAHRDDRRKTPHDQAVRVDQHPFLLDVGRLGRIRAHEIIHGNRGTGVPAERAFYTLRQVRSMHFHGGIPFQNNAMANRYYG